MRTSPSNKRTQLSLLEQVFHDSQNKQELFNLCLVSKAISSLALRYLYRSVSISPVDCAGITWIRRNAYPLLQKPTKLVHRLLGNQNSDTTRLVRELRVEPRFDVEGDTAMKATKLAVSKFISQDYLARLVERLPNLERMLFVLSVLMPAKWLSSDQVVITNAESSSRCP